MSDVLRSNVYLLIVALALGMQGGCKRESAVPPNAPATQAVETRSTTQAEATPPDKPTSTTQTATLPVETQPAESQPESQPVPKRPAPTWIIFQRAYEESRDADARVRWTGGNRLEVDTMNIKRLTLDLTQLPEGAPLHGPWNLQIDGQGIEITGRIPKEGHSGMIRDLVRSANGDWQVSGRPLYSIEVEHRRMREREEKLRKEKAGAGG